MLLLLLLLPTLLSVVDPGIRSAVVSVAAGALKAADGAVRSHDVVVAEHTAQLATRTHLSVIFSNFFDDILLI